MSTSHFVREFLRDPRSIGAIAPSSSALAQAMSTAADLSSRTTIFEFGPGTGAFTRSISAQLRPDQRYVGIEQNARFASLLADKFPHMTFVCGSVENLQDIAERVGVSAIDAIICGLPWASLPLVTQTRTFEAMRALMPANSVFATFAYLQGLLLPNARALRARLDAEFSNVTSSPVVWRNLPPAFIYKCLR
jgi:phosphatidylethanolamine/phosphatidyl-N-methylethanolamine N-methyltransferase